MNPTQNKDIKEEFLLNNLADQYPELLSDLVKNGGVVVPVRSFCKPEPKNENPSSQFYICTSCKKDLLGPHSWENCLFSRAAYLKGHPYKTSNKRRNKRKI